MACGNSEERSSQSDKSRGYLIYLHGAIVQQQGPEAVSEQFGPYLYQTILDSLTNKGFQVISEVRPKDAEIGSYAVKVQRQVRELIEKGAKPSEITILGASMGAYIALEASLLLDNPEIRYVTLGLCGESGINYFLKSKNKFKGKFLSIYELSDSRGSCAPLFENNLGASFSEVAINTGLDHGFLFRPLDEWVEPIITWRLNN
ncbi:hypothetical protein [Fulvivirga sedimenti]|uniref:Alpha/beta hydrolase n=1 Tax=Fulvivirga sedimenti TaxID=2879465 RepID=A0A9X1HWG0_9BACT|nr:hypothetical protein [Fulvivirga sedimenti]MCA6079101.1 hypothetical protein [Fulvivirga sedimenti]